ncbi:MAG: hypothetical protein ACI94Y_001990 [Maribacter sp.]|jgi:hypothetical protein
MILSTPLHIPKGKEISYNDIIVSIGSCFAENMGNKLEEGKFDIRSNSFGILYNPISIKDAILRIISNQPFSASEVFLHQDLWHSWMHHGRFSSVSKETALFMMNSSLVEAHQQLKKANRLIITLGTAYVYRKKVDGEVVANCHKVPSSEFDKIRLTVDEVYDALRDALVALTSFNPTIEIIITVSPVRHIRDGIIESQRSKAILLLAAEQLCKKEDTGYFPSYEIMMDELRDYRFYAEDMIHPSAIAIDYIWEKFRSTYFDSQTATHYKNVLKITKGFQHKILHPNTKEHLHFLEKQVEKASNIMKEIPVNFNKEIANSKGQLQIFKD